MKEFPLPKRRLGRTQRMVTPIGFGAAWVGAVQHDETAIQTTLRALDYGINLIDTSPLYSESERRVGLALAQWYAQGGKRDEIFLSTKTGTRYRPFDYSFDGTLRSVEKSLELLKTDYFDVVHVHDPVDLSPVLARHGALDALRRLKEQKTIRAIGLGVLNHEFHQRCIATGEFEVCLTYRDFNLISQSAADGILSPAAKQDTGVFNGMAIMRGLLGGRDPLIVAKELGMEANHPPDHPNYRQTIEIRRARKLWEFAQTRGIDLLALNLQYCLRESRIASTLVGAASPEEVDVDVRAVTEMIPEEIWGELETLMKSF